MAHIKKHGNFPLKSYFIYAFTTAANNKLSLSKDGSVLEGVYGISHFVNNRLSFKNHILLNINKSDIFEKKLTNFFKEIDYTHNFDTATEAIIDFLNTQQMGISSGDNLWLILPKPDKKPTGTKFSNTFHICTDEFKYGDYVDVELDVYMTKITTNTKSITFRVDIPDYIYNKCMENVDVQSRPELKYIESNSLSFLHTKMGDFSNMAVHIEDEKKRSVNYIKHLLVRFNSSEVIKRDSFNFAYMGQEISTRFNYCIIYSYEGGSLDNRRKYFTKKRVDDFHIDYINAPEDDVRKNYIQSLPENSVLIDYTPEREEFLSHLESKFRDLSTNLNSFLKDISTDTIDKIIEQSINNKLLT
jgi:hypothetical protein